MSASIVKPETINRIVTWLMGEFQENRWLYQKAEEFKIPTDPPKLALAMFELNLAAVNLRYNEKNSASDLKFSFYPIGLICNKIQVFKSLDCWLYECHEGKLKESKLYKFFNEVVWRWLAQKIIMELPEFQNARWG